MSRALQIGTLDFTSTALGVAWRGLKLVGWDGSPGSTLSVTQKPRDHGGWASEAFLPPKILTLTGLIVGSDPGAVLSAFDALNAAVSLAPTTLTVTDDGIGARTLTIYRQGEIIASPMPTNRVKAFSLQVIATDPRKYGAFVSVATGLPSQSGGETFPDTFPDSFPATVVSGVASIRNAGNISCPVQLRIDGPIVGPIVTHTGTNVQLVFSSSLTLAAGEFLIVDTGKRSVLAQGQARRDGYVINRGWFQHDPGPNDYALQAQAYNSSALLTVTAPLGAWQ